MSTLHDLQAAARQTLVSVATQPIAQGLSSLQASAQGLSSDEARTRLAQLGPNVVVADARVGLLRQLAQRIVNPLNILLLTLALVSVLTGNVESAVIITTSPLVRISRCAARASAMMMALTIRAGRNPDGSVNTVVNDDDARFARPRSSTTPAGLFL